MNVTLRQLRVFQSVARTRNFSRTGEAIGLTQPAVSRAIGELEHAMGLRLLDRTTREVGAELGVPVVDVFKEFKLGGDKKFRFEMDFGNLFNRTLFCNPNTNWSSPAFGTVNTQCNQARSVQFAVRFEY